MPHYVHHSVYNLEDTVSATDNPFYSTAIEESVFQLYKTRENFHFAYSEGHHIFVHKGLCLKAIDSFLPVQNKHIGYNYLVEYVVSVLKFPWPSESNCAITNLHLFRILCRTGEGPVPKN